MELVSAILAKNEASIHSHTQNMIMQHSMHSSTIRSPFIMHKGARWRAAVTPQLSPNRCHQQCGCPTALHNCHRTAVASDLGALYGRTWTVASLKDKLEMYTTPHRSVFLIAGAPSIYRALNPIRGRSDRTGPVESSVRAVMSSSSSKPLNVA